MSGRGPLPKHLLPYWGNRTDDPRESPVFCWLQSFKTPAIPWHNGSTRCLSCGEPTRPVQPS